MAFKVDDIVRKTTGTQKYTVKVVLPESKYKCVVYPQTSSAQYTFKEAELVLV